MELEVGKFCFNGSSLFLVNNIFFFRYSMPFLSVVVVNYILGKLSAQVVETSVTVTNNSPFQDYPAHPDDHTTRSIKYIFKKDTLTSCKGLHVCRI